MSNPTIVLDNMDARPRTRILNVEITRQVDRRWRATVHFIVEPGFMRQKVSFDDQTVQGAREAVSDWIMRVEPPANPRRAPY